MNMCICHTVRSLQFFDFAAKFACSAIKATHSLPVSHSFSVARSSRHW